MKSVWRDPHQTALIRAAGALGLRVEELAGRWGVDAVRFHGLHRSTMVIDGSTYPDLSHQTERICEDKRACKARLEELGIPTPPSIVLRGPVDLAAIAHFVEAHPELRFVCKPIAGTHGEGVAMGLRDAEAIARHAATFWHDTPMLVEHQVEGQDLRLQAIGGRLVAACRREPAFVTGDGRHTVAELVAFRAEQVRSLNPQNELVLDTESLALLTEQHLTVETVAPVARKVVLKRVANISQGGHPIDVTERIHPAYAGWMEAIARGMGLSIFALDVICIDPARPPQDGGAYALEVNARPQWLHHTFSEQRQHDIPTMILRSLLDLPGLS